MEEVKTHPLYCHFSEEEILKFRGITKKWKDADWWQLEVAEPLKPWVYDLTFDEFVAKLIKDKDEKTFEEIIVEYTELGLELLD